MSNLPETEDFAEGIYQIETSDRVLGGPGGIANKQAEQLGNRTAWLRTAIKKIIDGTTAIGKATQLATARTLRFKGAASGSSTFDGSADAEISLTLADSGIAAGSYTKVTFNAKGLATGGSNPDTLDGNGITDGVTKTALANAVNTLLPKSGGTMTGSVILSNGGEDTPEFGWKSPTCEAYIDMLNSQVRISANFGGNFLTPLLLNIPNKAASVFGYGLWHGGNLDPLKYAVAANTYTISEANQQINYRVLRDKITTVGLAGNDPNLPYVQRESDGVVYYLQPRLGFNPVQQGIGIGQLSGYPVKIGWSGSSLKVTVNDFDLGNLWSASDFDPSSKANWGTKLSDYRIADAFTKAEVNAGLAQKWDVSTYPPAKYITLGQDIPAGSNPRFSSSGSGPISYLSTATGALEVHNGGVASASAVAMFNRQGVFAAYFGLDTDNQFKVGGWSMGNVAHTLWHSGNAPKNTASLGANGWKKDADTGEIIQWVEVVVGEISGSRTQSITWPTTFPGAFLNARISFRQGASTAPANVNGAYFSPTTSGCQVRIDEWSGIDQGTSLTLIVEARGY